MVYLRSIIKKTALRIGGIKRIKVAIRAALPVILPLLPRVASLIIPIHLHILKRMELRTSGIKEIEPIVFTELLLPANLRFLKAPGILSWQKETLMEKLKEIVQQLINLKCKRVTGMEDRVM
jgi:hypothetical protein